MENRIEETASSASNWTSVLPSPRFPNHYPRTISSRVMSAMPAPPSVKSLKVCDDPTKASSMVFNADFNDAGIAAFSTIPPALIRPAHIFIFRHRCIPTRGQLREHQMRHAPADSSFPEVAGDQKFGFIRVAR